MLCTQVFGVIVLLFLYALQKIVHRRVTNHRRFKQDSFCIIGNVRTVIGISWQANKFPVE